MLIVCPNCKARFNFDEQKVAGGGIRLLCSKCRAIFRVARKGPAPVAASDPGTRSPDPPARIKVVVANESPAFCKAVTKVLATEPFDLATYNDGKEALTAIMQLKPEVVLLDVALPTMYGFEVCDAIRREPTVAATKIIFIASIYDKTRYKRAPQSLYGADDYIEKHHIPDSLAAMIYRLVSGQEPAAPSAGEQGAEETEGIPQELSRKEAAFQAVTRRELQLDERESSAPAASLSAELGEAHIKAKRLARIIVSDILLYNQERVEQGIKEGTFFDLLADDITEGRALYASRVTDEVSNTTCYLEDAFNNLIAMKQKELGL